MKPTSSLSLLGSLSLLLVWLHSSSASSEYCVTTDASTATHGCKTLDEYVEDQDSYNWSDAAFVFQEGHHNHSNELVVTNQTKLVLVGVAENKVIITCFNDTGFVFLNVSELTIANLTLAFCGQLFQWMNITSISALAFFYGHTLTIESVIVDSAPHGAVNTESVFGDIIVSDCRFVNGYVESYQHRSGCRFAFTDCSPSAAGSSNPKLRISQTYFINNTIASRSNSKCTHKEGIWSGGASVLIKCPHVSATLDGVHFEKNLGCFGGALTLILGSNLTYKNEVQIKNSNFVSNSGWYGGGIIIDVYYSNCSELVVHKKRDLSQILEISSSNFRDNSAHWSGGALYIRHKESTEMCTAGTIAITNCSFIENWLKSFGGVAIFNINYIADSVIPHTVPQYFIIMDKCHLERNYVKENTWNNSGSGVIVTKSNPHFEISDTSIVQNRCSGLVATTSNIIFRREVNITENRGSSGGGLLLCSGAILYFSHMAVLTIASNSAYHIGGGIMVEYDCRQAKPICFFQHMPRYKKGKSKAVVYLHDNTAHYSGDNLYGGSIESCTILKAPRYTSVSNSGKIFLQLFPHHSPNNDSTITSAPTRACFCENNRPNCNKNITYKTISPGGKFSIPLVLVGQWNSPTPGTMETKIKDRAITFSNDKSYRVFDLNKQCEEINLTLKAYPNQRKHSDPHKIELYVTTSNDISFTEHLSSYKSIYIYVMLEKCPFGFNIKRKDEKCNCQYLGDHPVTCNSSSNTSWNFATSRYTWLGSYNRDNVSYLTVADNCPPSFCLKPNSSLKTNTTSLIDPDSQCNPHRTGVLCGDCANGYSLILGGDDCVADCTNSTLSLIIAFLVLGVLLVFFLTIFDLTVAEGTIGGILFYANIFQINSDLYLQIPSGKHKNLAAVCKAFISWLNLDFGIPTCFYNGMNSYEKVWLQYLFPLYIWFLAGAIIYVSKKNAKIAALFRTNCVKVLSTLILLSYAKLTRLTMQIFRYHKIHLYLITDSTDLDNLSNTMKLYKWALDGKMEYFTKGHLPLFIVGVITVGVLAPYTLCLLFIRRLYRKSSHPALWWINKWRPFFDTYVGPYTSAGYCWTGLQLLARTLILIANEAQSTVLSSTLLTLIVLAVLVLVAWWAKSRIYKRRGHNLLEGVSLLNLILLQLAIVNTNSLKKPENIMWYSFISVTLTMLLFVGVICYHGYRQLFSLAYFKARSSGIRNWISNTSIQLPSSASDLDKDANQTQGSRLPSLVGSCDREPLLAEDD